MSGENQEMSGHFEVIDKWQPCLRIDTCMDGLSSTGANRKS